MLADLERRGPRTGQRNGGGGNALSPQSSSGARRIADATPPRVTSTPAFGLRGSHGRATDVDHWIFGDRKFYAMTLNMPNLNSAGGSWVIRFAELNGNKSRKKRERV